jgi:hypothetical protein
MSAVAIESEAQFDQVLRLVTNFTYAAAHPLISGQIRIVLVAAIFHRNVWPWIKTERLGRDGIYFNHANHLNNISQLSLKEGDLDFILPQKRENLQGFSFALK